MQNEMVSGSAPALGRRRVRLAPDMSKIPPACGRFFLTQPADLVLVHPRAGALPKTMPLLRLWRGGDCRLRSSALVVAEERLRWRIYVPVLFVVLLEIRGSKILSLGHLCLSDSFDFQVVRISEVQTS